LTVHKIAQACNIHVPHVWSSLKSLIARKIVIKYGPGRYQLQKDYEQWVSERPKPVPKQYQSQNGTGTDTVLETSTNLVLVGSTETVLPYKVYKQTIKTKNILMSDPDFETFWKAYPKKEGKQDAIKAWKKAKPDLTIILAAIQKRKLTEGWRDRQYIPLPATYINGKRWEDELPEVSTRRIM